MRAVVHERFGSPDVLELREVPKPDPADDEVLVRIHAASVNPVDYYAMLGRPLVARGQMGIRRPRSVRAGTDFAGTVEAVGKDVTLFAPGDEVFGGRTGALAEYVCVREERAIAHKPARVSFEEAAGVPVAAATALQALRDHGRIAPGQRVLVNGASGGVGTFTVQIAKALGAEVTGVCAAAKAEQARALGADHVIDYGREDFTRAGLTYDLVVDIAGGRAWSELRRVLEPDARLVVVGAPKGGPVFGPLAHVARLKLASARSGHDVAFFVARLEKRDLETLRDLLEAGTIETVVDRTYPLEQVRDAYRHLAEGHARGKIVVTLGATAG